MLKEQREKLSSFMDGDSNDQVFIEQVSQDKTLQHCWHRYHIARDAMQGKLHECSLTLDLSESIAKAIALEDLPTESLAIQPNVTETHLPKLQNLLWIKAKDIFAKVAQVGLAACVTLGIITGVQYQQSQSDDTAIPVLNTVPVGINVAPVGGISTDNSDQVMKDAIEQYQYNKIRLLVQDYELQKRLNVR